MKRLIVVCLMATLSIAAPRAQSPAVRMDGYPEPGTGPIVKLLSPGSGPRTALRFAIPATYKEHFDMGVDMSMAMEMAGASMPARKVPTMTVGGDVAVTGVAANGDVVYTMSFTGATVAPGGDPNIGAALQSVNGAMKGFKGTATVSNRGVIREMKVDQATANPQFAQMLDQFTNQAQNLSVPLPEEEVGVGARWEVRQAMKSGGMQVFQRVEYELAALDATSATLNAKLEQTAPAQSISNPALPAGAEVRLVSMTGTGSGKTTIRFDSVLPTGTANMESAMGMELSMGGNQQTMNARMSMKMTLTPKK